MKYYVIEIADGDEKIKGKSIYEYDNLNDAKATFHKKLGTAMASELYTSDLVVILSEYGLVVLCEKYTA